MPTNSFDDRLASLSHSLENEVLVSDEAIRHIIANSDGGYVKAVTNRIDELDAEIAELDRKVRQLRTSQMVTKRVYPSLKTWLLYLLAVVLTTMVLSSLILHMSELFGWGLYEWFNALLDEVEAVLTTAGGTSGPVHVLADVAWTLIVIVVGVLVSIPLGILHMAQVILPDAESYMGFLEGAVVGAAALLLLRAFPLAGEGVTSKVVRKRLPAAKQRELDELERELCEKKEQYETLVHTAYGI